MAVDFCLRKTVPVAGKSDPVCPNTILLRSDKPLTFGRIAVSGEVNVRLQSKIAPLMISRKHATVSCSDGKWTLLDHQSLNGVFVNGTKLQSNTPQELHIGDRIVFGVALESSPPEFEYIFDVMPSVKKRSADTRPLCNKEPKQRKVLSESGPNVSGSSEKAVIFSTKSNTSKQEAEAIALKEKLEAEKDAMQDQLKALEEKELQLNEELASQKAFLVIEKEKLEEQLKHEMNQKLELMDLELQEKLQNEKSKLEKIISDKESEQSTLLVELTKCKREVTEYKNAIERLKVVQANEKKLETNLEELKILVEQKEEELRQQQEFTKKAQEVAQTVVDQMEDEFSCIVCQELIIRATTLACSHSFCEYCLYSWLKKRNSCPVCRTTVQTQPIHSIVLDNAITKMVESMDDESRQRRKVLLQERAEKSRDVVFPIAQLTHAHRTGNERSYNDVARYVRFQEIRDTRRIPVRGYHSNSYEEVYSGGTNYNDRNYQQQRNGSHVYQQRSGGYGYNNVVCYACGMRGHVARGCPYSYQR